MTDNKRAAMPLTVVATKPAPGKCLCGCCGDCGT